MTSARFSRMATVTASTKRSPAAASSKIGAPTTHVASLACMPLYPVDAELVQRLPQLADYRELLETFVQGGVDIKEGDLLVISGVEYPVRAVEDWPWPPDDDTTYLRLVVEERKGS